MVKPSLYGLGDVQKGGDLLYHGRQSDHQFTVYPGVKDFPILLEVSGFIR